MRLNVADLLLACGLVLPIVFAGEMTFELPDRDRMCFHETVDKGVDCILEFQVIDGGNYDVDVILSSPSGAELYRDQRKQYGRHKWTTAAQGDYKFCFSNEFSTMTHKIVYFDFKVGDDDEMLRFSTGESASAMTQLEAAAHNIRLNLNTIVDYQTHFKLREAQGRSFAEDLNERVQYWSIGQTVVIVVAGVGQILILKSFFSSTKH